MNRLLAILLVSLLPVTPAAAESVTPDFGPNVLIFDASMTNIQSRIDAVFSQQERSQFGSNRFALFFKPGQYDLDVQVGFYTQVLGLGQSPNDVAITGAVRCKARWMANSNATCNFWRCVENLSVTPTQDQGINVWAVSQATALRRMHVKGNLNLWDGGWSSGGFIADCQIDGQVNSGSQQQWFSRNAEWGGWKGANWNMVFVGIVNPPSGRWPDPPYTVIDRTPVIREKPYLFLDESGRYSVMVPSLNTGGSRGTTWSSGKTPGTAIPIDRFYLARPESDNAASINRALNSGKDLLLTPGIYHLENCVRVTNPGAIVLGLGYPTLRVDNGTAALTISDVDGVKVAGILIEAGATNSDTLMQVGEPGSRKSHATDPVCLWDIFCRVGGAQAGRSTCMVTINSHNVVGDNFWLWRADHGRGAGWNSNPNKHGLIVNGDNVTLYGLFVEHTQEYQTVWNGNGGRVYFYQSEMPYDPPSQEAWKHGEVNGYASYKVADAVTTHEAWGLGVYCVFYAAPVVAENAIETPAAPGVKLHHMVTIRLSGRPNSGINHVINGTGDAVIATRKAIVN
ncbi:MAG TPA: coagulation factor 5/8 type domain-containing protein [Verrucomicrobiae bacterium]